MIDEKECEEVINSYTYSDWYPLLELIPQIEKTTSFEIIEDIKSKDEGTFTMPYCDPAPIVHQFLDVIHNIPVMIIFNWPDWNEGREMTAPDFDFNSVDLVTKCKLITAIVRNDRFCEGALVSSFDSGLILKILKSIEVQTKNLKEK